MGWHVVVLGAATLASCEAPHKVAGTFSLVFVVESDPGIRIEGARVLVNGRPMGDTDSSGLVRTRIYVESEQPLRIQHECPQGYEEPSQPKTLRLRPFEGIDASAPGGMEITLRCRPTKRLAAFVVRAKNGPHLPVLLDGQEVARTNANGVAHFSASAGPSTEFSIQLDTNGLPRLRPKSPMYLYTLPDADEIFVVNQSFEVDDEPRRARHRRPRIIKIE